MLLDMDKIKQFLDNEVINKNVKAEFNFNKPDPLMIARKYQDEYISLVCALFAYGSAKQIVKFLSSLNFDLLNQNEIVIKKELKNYYYRFQKQNDIMAIFIALRRLKQEKSLEEIFQNGYRKKQNVLDGIDELLSMIKEVYKYDSAGYRFLIGNKFKRDNKDNIAYTKNSPYKRYNMFLRWLIRNDNIDMGLWKSIDKKDLILPLDTHTFKVSQKLGLLKRKIYDLKSAILITDKLKQFDGLDPIKYDFAIYRLGQEKTLIQI